MEDKTLLSYKTFLTRLNLTRTRVGCLLGCVLTFALILLDHLTNPESFFQLLVIRVNVCAFLLLLYSLTFTPLGKIYIKALGMAAALSLGVAIALMIRQVGGYESPYYAGLNLIILVIALLMPWEVIEITLISVAIYSFYIGPILLFDDIKNFRIFFNNNIFMINTIIIAIASGYFTSKLRYNEFAARIDLVKARDELKEMDRLKTHFFSTISHELRTPLANIMLPIQNILARQGELLNPDNKAEKEAMLRNARRLMKRINEILDISKLEAGKMQVSVNLQNLNSILEDIVSASAIGAKEMGIDLKAEFDESLPSIYIDREKMEKVCSNLIGNALKFTKQGGSVTVETKEKKDRVEIVVSDTGIGISPKVLPYIFDRFRQVDGTNSRKYEGTGLGLTIVKEFVELHNGVVNVSSELNRGTTFTVSLQKGAGHFRKEQINEYQNFKTIDGFEERRSRERRRHERRGHDRRQMSYEDRDTIDSLRVQLSDLENVMKSPNEGIEQANGDKSKKHVLIVEDNMDLAGNIARSLGDIYNVSVAYNGRQGLEWAQHKVPDLIISDLMMPEMDGFEFCERLKTENHTQHIPFILLTARATVNDKIEGLKHGADHYLSKPFNPNELRAVAESLLTKKELEAELSNSNLELKKTLRELEGTQSQLIHAARLESVGLLAAGIAHEIKNNIYCVRAGLTGINKRLALLSEGKIDIKSTYESLQKALKTNDQAIDSSINVINTLLAFSGKEKKGVVLCDVNLAIENTLTIIAPRISDKIIIEKSLGKVQKIECRQEELNQVFMNIILNAYQAIGKNGKICIITKQEDNMVVISIADDGPGIPEENLEKIFLPFFSTKEKENNTGLGLSICYNIIKNHHGKIGVKSNLDRGTEFIIRLPIKQAI